jgi:hypothetical protein
MAEAAYATGPALLGAPRLLSSIFFLNFLFPVSARGPNSAQVRGPKEPKSPRKFEAPKNVPKRVFFPVLVFQRGAPKSPGKVLRKRYSPQNCLKIVPCFSAGSKQRGVPKSPRPPKAKPQTKKTSRSQT